MSNTLTLGSTTINLPPSYSYEPNWLESNERTLDGSIITNKLVTTGDVAISKKRFSFSGIQKFSTGFTGSTTTSATLQYEGSTSSISVHILSESYRYLYSASTGNVLEYSFVVEEE
jgi:hypothetical protein